MIETEIQNQFVELRAKGLSFASIAERLSVSKTTLIAWSRDLKEDIANMRQIELEALREKYRMGVEHRTELFSKQLNAIEGELGKRDLSTVPTERLMDLLMKFGKELATTDAPLALQLRMPHYEPDFQYGEELMRRWVA